MRIVICGAGITGLALANRLAAHGDEVVVLERAPGPRPQGYMIDFFGPGLEAADAMSLRPGLEGVAYHYDEGGLVDRHGRRRATLRTKSFTRGPLLSIMRPDLERVLRDSLPSRVDLRFGTALVDVHERADDVAVTLQDGTVLQADLLVGADGIHSTVRRLVFGPEERFLRYLGLHTAAFVFDEPDVHALTRHAFCLTDSIDRQMGFYALRDGRVAAFAVHRTSDPALPEDARTAIRRHYDGLGWVVPRALERCPPSEQIYYDQVAQTEVPQWSQGRTVLLGDASHAVSLIAGQGASLGIAGAFVLADRLAHSGSVERAVSEFEGVWRPVVEDKQRNARSAARWFLPASQAQLRMRRAALGLTRFPWAARYVTGLLAGDETKLSGLLNQPVPSGRDSGRARTPGRRHDGG